MNWKLIAALFLALFLSACDRGDPTATENEPMNQSAEATLTGTSWWVEDIEGGGVIDNSRVTVEFVEDGRVAGNASCNRYMGGYAVAGYLF